jgi:predicted metal-dependent phosphoesterase TrpH
VYYALDALGVIPIYRREETYKAAFKTGEAANIKIYVPQMKDVINAIREAGGIAVLAHPPMHAFQKIRTLVDLGLKGIEICHPSLSEEQTKYAVHAAMEYNLYCSGGTDHTGPMSACGGKHAVPAYQGATQDEYNAIKERRLGI